MLPESITGESDVEYHKTCFDCVVNTPIAFKLLHSQHMSNLITIHKYSIKPVLQYNIYCVVEFV